MTRMHSFVLPLCASLALIAAMPASAQGDLKIGFVNISFLIQNAPQTALLEQKLRAEFAEQQADLETAIEAFQERSSRFERDMDLMSVDERTEEERELTLRGRELERRQTVLQEDINFRQNDLLNELQNSIGRAVQAYVDTAGYDLVLTNALYVSEAIDITEQVLEAISPESAD